MEIQIPPFKKKRQFGRIKLPVPTRCLIYIPQSSEFQEYPGLIKNISLGGIDFVCDAELPIKKGNIRDLIIDVLYNDHKIYRLMLHGLVVCARKRLRDCSQFAVAFKFLSDPSYCQLKDSNYMEILCPDNTRILYQHYQLFRKAFIIIKKNFGIKGSKNEG